MRSLFSSAYFWMCLLSVVLLGPMAVYLGTQMGWPPGAALYILIAVPMCAAALSGQRFATLLVVLGAATVRWGESLHHGVQPADQFLFPFVGLCLLFLVGGFTAYVVDLLHARVEKLEVQNTNYVQQVFQLNRREQEADKPADEKVPVSENDEQTSPDPDETKADPTQGRSVDNAMLLLAIQDITRRISTHLDLDTLLPVIVNTARTSLKCGGCRILFWNSDVRKLAEVTPGANSSADHVPKPDRGMCGWVIEKRQALTRKDVEAEYALHSLKEQDPHMPDAIAPLAVGDELLGLLVIDDVEEDSPTFVRLLYILANNYALAIKNAQLFQRIEEMARRDGLTGLLNHASFQQELQELCEASASLSRPLTVVMSDVDHFKKFNDTYGHQAGDHVLREVAAMFQAVMPDHAVVARYGGEEFICALPGDDLDRGHELAELMRSNLEARTLDFDGQQLHVTASFGVTQFGKPAETAEDMVRIADEGLYMAKSQGRNQVVSNSLTESVKGSTSETINQPCK